jgi:CRP-like cAMP-binding protein
MPINLIAIKFTLIFFALCRVAFALGRATMAAGRAAKILCGLPGGDRDQQSEAAISDNQRNAVAAGPAISAVPFHETADGRAVALLNERERGLLARIAMRVHFRRGATIYREGDPADFVYNIAAGVVKAFRTLTDGRQRIVAFLFAEDLIGLAEEGVYVNQAEAVTAVTAYRIPLRALDNLARTDPTLDYSLLLKLTHELRAAQCHALILARHDAVGRIAMFIAMLQRLQQERGVNGDEIRLPMSRSDIADYVGMPLSTVSRSFRSLIAGNIVRFTDRRHLRIIDRARFEELLSQPARGREAEP